jgi:hypothetical protein
MFSKNYLSESYEDVTGWSISIALVNFETSLSFANFDIFTLTLDNKTRFRISADSEHFYLKNNLFHALNLVRIAIPVKKFTQIRICQNNKNWKILIDEEVKLGNCLVYIV